MTLAHLILYVHAKILSTVDSIHHSSYNAQRPPFLSSLHRSINQELSETIIVEIKNDAVVLIEDVIVVVIRDNGGGSTDGHDTSLALCR